MQKISIVFCCVMCLLSGIFYVQLGRNGGSAKALVMKGIASLFFFLTGLLSAFYRPISTYGTLILPGLFFGMLADIVFGARFIAKKKPARFFVSGALLFAIGHGFYIVAFNTLGFVSVGWYLAALFVTAFIFFSGKIFFRMHYGKLWPMILLYCLIVNLMLFSSISVSNLLHPSSQILIAAAAFLFTFSDIVLLYSTFVKKLTILHFLNICPYYAGQLMFALSIAVI